MFYGFRTTTAISHRVNSEHINQKRKICTKIQKRRVYLRLKFGFAGLPALLTLLLGPDTPPPSPHTITVVAILTLGLPRLVTMITTLTQHSAHILDCGGSFSIAGQTVANWRHVSAGSRPGSKTWTVPGSLRRDFPVCGLRDQGRSRLRRHPDEPSVMQWTLGCVFHCQV